MSLPTKVINIRLSAGQAARFKALKEEFAGLPQATLLRILISACLDFPMSQQIDLVNRQIRKPG
jgi:hypothetical protein